MHWSKYYRLGWLVAAIGVFLVLASYQLHLPGLHYDEAKEAGVNAVELLHGVPVTAFRSTTISAFGLDLPLMVQDYIGALNVYLVLPFLAATDISVPNLRVVSLFLAVLGLLALERSVSEWLALCTGNKNPVAPIAPAALISVTLLVAAPSFVFWQRQGIFVTNATFPCTFACIWTALGWLRLGRGRTLLLSAFCGGLAIYAKLIAAWIIVPFVLACATCRLWRPLLVHFHVGARAKSSPSAMSHGEIPQQTEGKQSHIPITLLLTAGLAFLLPLSPFLWFNLQTGGTLASISNNLATSYFGVDNTAIWENAATRLRQLIQILDGGHLWYLGTNSSNALAPSLAGMVSIAALTHAAGRRLVGPPLMLLGMALTASLFTVSGLHVTHYALLHPLAIAVAGIGLQATWKWSSTWQGTEDRPKMPAQAERSPRGLRIFHRPISCSAKTSGLRFFLVLLMFTWMLLDLQATSAYHRALSESGGLSDHSDAYHQLAFDLLDYGGELVVLDWGMEAQIRYLSKGKVNPIEIFGYASLHKPDEGFAKRLELFLDNEDNVYLLKAPDHEVFRGRRPVFERLVQEHNRCLWREKVYYQGDGNPLIERWRVLACPG